MGRWIGRLASWCAVALVVGCQGAGSGDDSVCMQLAERMVELQAEPAPDAPAERRAELEKHARVMRESIGPRIAADCRTWSGAQVRCAKEASSAREMARCATSPAR